jgi:hypothetical protein
MIDAVAAHSGTHAAADILLQLQPTIPHNCRSISRTDAGRIRAEYEIRAPSCDSQMDITRAAALQKVPWNEF